MAQCSSCCFMFENAIVTYSVRSVSVHNMIVDVGGRCVS